MDYHPQKPVIIRPFVEVAERDVANNDFAANHPGLEEFGGYFGRGTALTSTTSGTIANSYFLTFTPSNGVVTGDELTFAQVNRMLERQQEIRGV